ncbi:hypothetical protein A4F89_01750 [Polynucleobacter asymbioticus]|uniref:Uncharacterized protein n=1 Tax=Polynucleobacter asymbioticus TaxID=576611 RepID=A0AAC9NI19_9BURK|nr:hypothetical protein A4F89_01750 [Polynucleobacter asymbioticus]APC00432.1 hypothetical protein AOC25_01755 [Polynucleobacter asymbioticus]
MRGWVFLAISVLLVVWALPHTIAARNIALFSGLLAAFGWLILRKPAVSWQMCWPSICLLLVPAWVLLHWYALSDLQAPQWEELNSTWLRTACVIILGTIAGWMLSWQPQQIVWIVIAISLLPTVSFGMYLQQVYLQHHWVLPGGMFYGAFKAAKFSMVYFVLCQVLVGFGLIYFAMKSWFLVFRAWVLVLGVSLVLIGMGDFLSTRGLNGVLISALGFLVCLGALLFYSLMPAGDATYSQGKRIKLAFLGFLAAAIIGAALYGFWAYDQRYEGKLSHLLGDIQISSQIEKNQSWVRQDPNIADPVDSSGRPVNASTYERVSWFMKGIELIGQHPWGNGISHQAFGYYMRAQFPKSTVLMTHSAWVDYTLGLGLPGLALIWSAIFGVLVRGLKLQTKVGKTSPLGFGVQVGANWAIPEIALWLILGMFCFWFIGEVSEREYLEQYFFLIALFSSCLGALIYRRSAH